VAQLVARKSHNLKVPGSIPGGGILLWDACMSFSFVLQSETI
jgi:hypothetical protein